MAESLAALGSLAGSLQHLQASLAHTTTARWDVRKADDSRSYEVVTSADQVGAPFVVVRVLAERDAVVIARARSFAPGFASAAATVLALLRVVPAVSERAVAGAIGSGVSTSTMWRWVGWSPATRGPVIPEPRSALLHTWVAPVSFDQSASFGGRFFATPKADVAELAAWGASQDDPRSLVKFSRSPNDTSNSEVVFARPEDASFIREAAVSTARFGSAVEAVWNRVESDPASPFDSGELMELMESTPPWPLRREPRTV